MLARAQICKCGVFRAFWLKVSWFSFLEPNHMLCIMFFRHPATLLGFSSRLMTHRASLRSSVCPTGSPLAGPSLSSALHESSRRPNLPPARRPDPLHTGRCAGGVWKSFALISHTSHTHAHLHDLWSLGAPFWFAFGFWRDHHWEAKL